MRTQHLSIVLALLTVSCIEPDVGPSTDRHTDAANEDDGGLDGGKPHAGDAGDAAVLPDGCVVPKCDSYGAEHFNTKTCMCEPCVSPGECGEGMLCFEGNGCVECTEEDDSICDKQGKVCDSATNKCVECNETADCMDPGKPVCSNHTCKPCGGSDACLDNKICIEDAGPFLGHCVECTAEELGNCAVDGEGKRDVCNARTLTCQTGVKEKSGTLCGTLDQTTCVSNSQCPDDSVCVQEFFGEAVFDSWHCMPVQGGPLCKRPFTGEDSKTTIDGTMAMICSLSLSTCTAHAEYRNAPCAKDGQPDKGDDSKCGIPGADDGYCVNGGAVLGWRCTVPCSSDDALDCPDRASPACTSKNHGDNDPPKADPLCTL